STRVGERSHFQMFSSEPPGNNAWSCSNGITPSITRWLHGALPPRGSRKPASPEIPCKRLQPAGGLDPERRMEHLPEPPVGGQRLGDPVFPLVADHQAAAE